MAGGDNSGVSVAEGQLRAFFERIERLHEERKAIGDDITEVFAEAKGNGFDVKAMKIVLQKRRMDSAERLEQEAIVELYMSALGMTQSRPMIDISPSRAPAGAPAHASKDRAKHQPAVPAADSDRGIAPARNEAPVATESTAARMDVHTVGDRIGGAAGSGERKPSNAMPGGIAGTQAPPVDTIQEPLELSHADPQRSGAATRKDAGTGAPEPKPAPFKSSAQQAMDDALARQQKARADGGLVGAAAQLENADRNGPHPQCLDQPECGSSPWRNGLCKRCQLVAAGQPDPQKLLTEKIAGRAA